MEEWHYANSEKNLDQTLTELSDRKKRGSKRGDYLAKINRMKEVSGWEGIIGPQVDWS